MKCKKCLYRANCQFLAKHKGAEVEGCTAFKDAADFVEVVRCKDCEYRSYKDGKYYECPRHFTTIYVKGSDFCSYGERKDGGSE